MCVEVKRGDTTRGEERRRDEEWVEEARDRQTETETEKQREIENKTSEASGSSTRSCDPGLKGRIVARSPPRVTVKAIPRTIGRDHVVVTRSCGV